MNWKVYILQCSDGSFYTGITTDLNRRIIQHNNGVAAKYTKGRRPVKLLYQEHYKDRGEATKRELELKRFKKAEKRRLIANQSTIDSAL